MMRFALFRLEIENVGKIMLQNVVNFSHCLEAGLGLLSRKVTMPAVVEEKTPKQSQLKSHLLQMMP